MASLLPPDNGRSRFMPQHAAAAINLREFGDNGVVSAAEYKDISGRLLEKLQGMRVPVIRKGFELEPYDYDEYVSNANECYDRAFAPIADPEMGVEINCVSLFYRAKFSMSFFRDFVQEYFQVMRLECISFADVAVEVTEDGFSVAPTSQFRSLLLAGLQIEQEVKERFKKSGLARDVGPDITVETRFFLPMNQDLNESEPMMAVIQVDLYPED